MVSFRYFNFCIGRQRDAAPKGSELNFLGVNDSDCMGLRTANSALVVSLLMSFVCIVMYFAARLFNSEVFVVSFEVRTALMEYVFFYACLAVSDISLILAHMITMGIYMNTYHPFEYQFNAKNKDEPSSLPLEQDSMNSGEDGAATATAREDP